MPLVDLVHPGNLPSEVIVSTVASSSKKIGRGDDTEDMVIKVSRARFKFTSPQIETTGDGDTVPIFENNGLLYGTFSLSGAMVHNIAVGLQNLHTQTYRTGSVVRFYMKFHMDATTAIGGSGTGDELSISIESLEVAWSAKGPIVPMTMTGRYSNYNNNLMEITNSDLTA